MFLRIILLKSEIYFSKSRRRDEEMIKEKNYLCAEDMIQLDCEKEFIPLTFNGMFKALFKKDLNLLKDFMLSQIGLEIEDGMCKIEL